MHWRKSFINQQHSYSFSALTTKHSIKNQDKKRLELLMKGCREKHIIKNCLSFR